MSTIISFAFTAIVPFGSPIVVDADLGHAIVQRFVFFKRGKVR